MILPYFTISIFFLSLSFLLLSNEAGIVRKIMSPYGVFVVFFSSVFYFIPSLQMFIGVGRFKHLIDNDSYHLLSSILLAMLYQISVVFMFVVLKRPKVNFHSLKLSSLNYDKNSKLITFFCLIVFVVGSIFVFYLFKSYLNNFSVFMIDRINIFSGNVYFLKMISYSLPLLIFLFLKNRGRVLNFIFILIAIISFVVFILLGSRTNAVIVIPYIIIVYLFINPGRRLNKKSMVKIIAVFGVLMVAMALLANVREYFKSEGIESLNSISLSSQESSFSESIVKQFYLNYGQAELLALTIERKNEYSKALGHTIYAGFVSFVPRVLWEDKPVGGGPMLANIISPGAYVLRGKEGNSSFTTGLLLEGYLNFSVAGVLVFALLHGFFICKVTRYSNRLVNSADFVIYIMLFFGLSLNFVTGEFLGVFSSLVFTILPIYFLNKLTMR